MEKIDILSIPADFDKSDFLSLLSLSAGTVISRQKRMGGLIGSSGWNIDIRNRRIKFGEHEFDCGIIGTESNSRSRWLWGWADTGSKIPEIAFAPSRRVKRRLPDCAELQTGAIMLDELRSGHNFSIVTAGFSEKNVCYYRCPFEDGALFVQVEGLPEEIFEPLPLIEIARGILEIIGSMYCDHRLLTEGFLYQNGYSFEIADNNGISRIYSSDGENQLAVSLESDFGRITDVSMTPNSARQS